MPTKGHLKRSVMPSSVPFTFSSVYQTDALFPASNAQLGDSFVMRDVTGLPVEIQPVQYNPVRGEVKITKYLRIRVVAIGAQVQTPVMVDPSFFSLYQEIFVNFDSTLFLPSNTTGPLVIIYGSKWVTYAQQLQAQKVSLGWDTTIVDVATVGASTAAIKTYIASQYTNKKISYVILIGKDDDIPAPIGKYSYQVCDTCYTFITQDYSIDVFISRISGVAAWEFDQQIKKFINYESQTGSKPYYWQALEIASNQGSPKTDCVRVTDMATVLTAFGYKDINKQCDPTASLTKVISSINSGVSILNYVGHGSGTSWSTTGFDLADAHGLKNEYLNPMVLDASCDNGDFSLTECLAEALMKGNQQVAGSGVISMYSSAPEAEWDPPVDSMDGMLKLITTGQATRVGPVYFGGAMIAYDKWSTSTSGKYLVEGYVLFGDATMGIHTGIQAQ